MTDYVAYHSATVMGRPYDPSERFTFFSSKPEATLRHAIGNRAWVIASERAGRKTSYFLSGVFLPSAVVAITDGCEISGDGTPFEPSLEVTEMAWFRDLRREQANFSLGFSQIRSASVVAELAQILDAYSSETLEPLPEEIPDQLFTEGGGVRIVVNRYERDRNARAACLRANGTTCVVCRTDLSTIYGPIAKDLIHVHHVMPISRIAGAYQVDPKEDLIPVCPNCHAVLHRKNPPIEPRELEQMIANARERAN